ncbi:MAG: hypothetical protein SGILL_007701 [Bacillariaceae sp.]
MTLKPGTNVAACRDDNDDADETNRLHRVSNGTSVLQVEAAPTAVEVAKPDDCTCTTSATSSCTEESTSEHSPQDEEEEEEHMFYFGYGAMCNPISRRKRNIHGVNYWPAILPNHRIDFSNAGAASVVEVQCCEECTQSKICPKTSPCRSMISAVSPPPAHGDCCVHGVLMEFKDPIMWDRTKKSEGGYSVKQIYVYPYEQDRPENEQQRPSLHLKPIKANVFYFADETPEAEGIPQERYLRIIAQGMGHHNVCSNYVQKHILAAKCVPVRKPCDYIAFPRVQCDDGELSSLTFDDYVERAKTTSCFLLGDFIVDIEEETLPPDEAPICKFLKSTFIGKGDIIPILREIFYDPDVMHPSDCHCLFENFCWQKWSENQLTDIFNSSKVGVCISHKLERASNDNDDEGQV